MSKRRGKGEGHIKKVTLKSGVTAWRGWLTVGYRANGNPIRRTVQRRTREEVRAGMVKLREKYQVGLDLEAERMRLDTLLDKWFEHWKATNDHKKRTPETYTWAIKRIKAGMGNPMVTNVTPLKLQTWLNAQAEDLKKGSLNLLRVVLSAAFHHAQVWRVRPDNPAEGLKLPKVDADERRIISREHAQQLIQELSSERLGLAVALTYLTAMRPGEAAALRWRDLDLDAQRITVTGTHNIVNGEIIRERPKTKRGERSLRIVPELRPWIEAQRERTANERAAMGERWQSDEEGLIFVRESDGGRISNHTIYALSRRVSERVGIGAVGPRILRRSMLSYLAHVGVESKVRAAIGGHTTSVTEKHYHEVAQDETDAAIEHMRTIIGSFSPPGESIGNAIGNAENKANDV
jgi:integrase